MGATLSACGAPPSTQRARWGYEAGSPALHGGVVSGPICNAKIRPLRDSYTRDAVLKDEIDYEDAKKVVIVTHFRHIHTDYDKIRKGINSRKLVDKLKEEKTNEAIELAKKHGLLPPNFSKEEYDRIALKIKRMYGLT